MEFFKAAVIFFTVKFNILLVQSETLSEITANKICTDLTLSYIKNTEYPEDCMLVNYDVTSRKFKKIGFNISEARSITFSKRLGCSQQFPNDTNFFNFNWKDNGTKLNLIKEEFFNVTEAACVDTDSVIDQKFTFHGPQLMELLIELNNCNFGRFESASGQFYLLQDSTLSRENITVATKNTKLNLPITQNGFISITSVLRKANSEKPVFNTKHCKVEKETYSVLRYIVGALFFIPILTIMIIELQKCVRVYINRNRVYSFNN